MVDAPSPAIYYLGFFVSASEACDEVVITSDNGTTGIFSSPGFPQVRQRVRVAVNFAPDTRDF